MWLKINHTKFIEINIAFTYSNHKEPKIIDQIR